MAEDWIVPCNIKRFNVIDYFKTHETAVWKNSFTIHTGDTVYIYVGAPLSQIKFRCSVISDEVSDELLLNNPYAIQEKSSNNYFSKKVKYIQIKLEHEYQDDLLNLNVLREHGLGQVQIQARPDRNLKKYLDEINKQLNLNTQQ